MSAHFSTRAFRIYFGAAIILLIAIGTADAQSAGKAKETPEKKLQGYWKSSEAVIEFKPGSKITINGTEYDYALVGPTIIVSNDEGEMEFPYKYAADVLTVWVEGRKVAYTRPTADEIEKWKKGTGRSGEGGNTASGGGVSQELVGKWCYQANLQAQAGGRMSNICFTLKADGTYEYYGETSNSNIYGGSNSQSSDHGRWSATSTSLIARSNSGKTTTYTLERRNHPKTGDPMLMVDGDAFVTFYQKRPW